MVRSGPRGYRSSKGSTSGRNERRDLSIPRDIVPAKMYEKYYRVAWNGDGGAVFRASDARMGTR